MVMVAWWNPEHLGKCVGGWEVGLAQERPLLVERSGDLGPPGRVQRCDSRTAQLPTAGPAAPLFHPAWPFLEERSAEQA